VWIFLKSGTHTTVPPWAATPLRHINLTIFSDWGHQLTPLYKFHIFRKFPIVLPQIHHGKHLCIFLHNCVDYSTSSNPLLHWPHSLTPPSISGLDSISTTGSLLCICLVVKVLLSSSEGASKQQMIDYYIQTLAKVLRRYILLEI